MKSFTLRALGLCAAVALFSSSSPPPKFSSPAPIRKTSAAWAPVPRPRRAGLSSAKRVATLTSPPAGSSTVGVAPNFTDGALTAQTIVAVTPAQNDNTNKGTKGYNYVNSAADIASGEGTRSLGSSPSGNAATILELALTNTTGSSINAVNLSYDIDRFTTVSNTNNAAAGFPNTGVEELPAISSSIR